MNKFALKINGEEKKEVLTPTGRHEVTIEQWDKAYKWLDLAAEANQDFEDGNTDEAQRKIVASICGTIEALSIGITYDELIQIKWDKVNKLFMIAFSWLQEEEPKKEFKIKGKKFYVPDFMRGTAGDFMDVMSLLSALKENEEHEKGLLIAAIYMRDGEYYQDLEEINARVEFLREHGRMDLFYSCAFFLLNSLKIFNQITPQPLVLLEEMAKLTSTLNSWGSTLYLHTRQNRESSATK